MELDFKTSASTTDSYQEKRRVWIARAPFGRDLQQSLERIFENVFCSAVRVGDGKSSGAVYAYVVAAGGAIRLVILFSQQRNTVKVLNEIFALSSDDLEGFINDIFRNYDNVDTISFPSVSVNAVKSTYPFQRFNATEDIVARLPETSESYWAMLSKNTRESIRRYQKQIVKKHPELKFCFYERDAVERETVLALIDLSRARIELKSEKPSHTEESIEQLTRMISKYGVTLVATLYGKVCGGVICTRVGENFFMHVLAHDPALDAFRLGKICCYLSICDAIERGGKEYHMLSGQYEYKYRFMGQQRDFDRIILYRSYFSVLFRLPRYLMNGVWGNGRRIKKTLKNWRRQWTK